MKNWGLHRCRLCVAAFILKMIMRGSRYDYRKNCCRSECQKTIEVNPKIGVNCCVIFKDTNGTEFKQRNKLRKNIDFLTGHWLACRREAITSRSTPAATDDFAIIEKKPIFSYKQIEPGIPATRRAS